MAEQKTCKKSYSKDNRSVSKYSDSKPSEKKLKDSKMGNKNLIRQKITHEAVNLICEMGINNLQQAKTKAAKKFAVHDIHLLPSNEEILLELQNYRELFNSEEQKQDQRKCQQQVLKLMHLFKDFNPRLADTGFAHDLIPNSPIEIFISASSLEEICIFLLDANIPYHLKEKKIFIGKNKTHVVPYFDLPKERYKIQLTFLALEKPPIRPLSPIDSKPLQYINLKKAEAQFALTNH